MYLAELQIEGFRTFRENTSIQLHKGINLLVGENGSGKSSVIDAIRVLLNESEFSHRGVLQEDFHHGYTADFQERAKILISGYFTDLDEEQKIEYLTWLTPSSIASEFKAKLTVEYAPKVNGRNQFRPKRWGGASSNSIFDWEPLNDIQCVYLPALRDAERKLQTGRGSRLAKFMTNLAGEKIETARKSGEKTDLEKVVQGINESARSEDDIKHANKLINENLSKSAGPIFGQSTRIEFSEPTYEKIVESLQLLFAPGNASGQDIIFRNLYENSLGYNNLIYIATILAEFEGLKDRYTTPRILLIEELEAHLHPQLQIRLLQYLSEQAKACDIQVIITTHSPILAAAIPLNNIISFNFSPQKGKVIITPIQRCELEDSTEHFLNRWLDSTKAALLFAKGIFLVEGLAEAFLIPKLAEVHLKQLKKKHPEKNIGISSLEDAGISVINMSGIYFRHFMQLYQGYSLLLPKQEEGESQTAYKERLKEFLTKDAYEKNTEYHSTEFLPARCVGITDNDPSKEDGLPTKECPLPGKNPQLFLCKQLENMSLNCRLFSNLKTFEYDLALESHHNMKIMLDIVIENLPTDGPIKERCKNYLEKIEAAGQDTTSEIRDEAIANDILERVDSDYLGKGYFAQLLYEKVDDEFSIPPYIESAFNFVLGLEEEDHE